MKPDPEHQTTVPERTARTRRILVFAGIGAVLIAVLIAFFAGGDDDPITTSAEDADVVEIASQVEVTGTPLPPLRGSAIDPAVGRDAPALDGVAPDGSPVTVEPGGQPILLVFVAHWCPDCQAAIPRLAEPLAGTVPGDAEVVLVSTGQVPDRGKWPPSEWLDEEGWATPVLVDDVAATAASSYGLISYPYFVMIDAEGEVTERSSGRLAPAEVLAMIERAVAQ